MSIFELAIPGLLKQEGGFVNDPTDPGGATNHGISLRWLKSIGEHDGDLDHDGDVDINDVKGMTDDQASAFYRKFWWDKYGYGRINSQPLATKVLSMSVNMGSIQAHTLLQRACWAINGYQCIADDSVLGAQTIAMINNAQPLQPYRSEAAGFYRTLIAEKPAFEKYKTGWLRRAYE